MPDQGRTHYSVESIQLNIVRKRDDVAPLTRAELEDILRKRGM